MAVRPSFASDTIVQKLYVDDDVDQTVRVATEERAGQPIVNIDYADVVGGAIVWWRVDNIEEEDLADVLVNVMSSLDDDGPIQVLIPRPRHLNSICVGDVEETAEITGLHATTSMALGDNWAGVRLAARPRLCRQLPR